MSRYLTPLLLIAIAVALFFGFTRPLLDEVAATKDETASYAAVLNNASELATVRDALLKQYNAISGEDRARLNKSVPDQVDNVRLIIDVDTVASRYGMKVRNAQVSADVSTGDKTTIGPDGKKYANVSLAFGVSGSYANLKRFLADLEQSLRVVDITSLEFTASDKDVNDYSIKLRTYWYRGS